MNNPIRTRRTIALAAVANAVFSVFVALAAVWGGAWLAAIPWSMSLIISLGVAVWAGADRTGTAARPVPVHGRAQGGKSTRGR